MSRTTRKRQSISHHAYVVKRRRSFIARIIMMLILGISGLIYFTYFRIYDRGPQTVFVNGEGVEQVDTITRRSTVWVSRPQIEAFMKRIGFTVRSLPYSTIEYHGVSYVQAVNIALWLTKQGDQSSFNGQNLRIQLRTDQHYSYTSLGNSVRQKEISVNGRSTGDALTVYHDEAAYISPDRLVALLSLSNLRATWNGTTLVLSSSGKTSPAPSQPSLNSAVIELDNQQTMIAPLYHWDGKSYIAVYSVAAALTKMGFSSSFAPWVWALRSDSTRNSQNQDMSSGVSGKSNVQINAVEKPTILAFVPFYAGGLNAFHDVTQHPSVYNAVAADIWTLAPSGTLIGSKVAGTAVKLSASQAVVNAMFSNVASGGASGAEMTSILKDSNKCKQVRDEIVRIVQTEGYNGATLDFESVPAADQNLFTAFVSQLAIDLHARGKQVQVVVPADTGYRNEPWNRAYDQTKLGMVADSLIVMAYDYSYPGGKAGPISPLPWVEQALAYTVSRVPTNKVLLGIDTYGYDWSGKQAVAVGLAEVDSFLRVHKIRPNWDPDAQSPWYTWMDSKGVKHTVYYDNAQSITAKLEAASTYGVRGIAVWRAGLEDSAVRTVFSNYAKVTPY